MLDKRNNLGLKRTMIAIVLSTSSFCGFATTDKAVLDSPLVTLYQSTDTPEKGPVRIRFLIDDSLAVKLAWDEDFKKRHLLLREVKKGFAGYMYQFESDLISPDSQCEQRNQKAHVNIVLKVSDINTGYSNDDFLNFYQLKLESYIDYTIAKVEPSKSELGYIQFSEPKRGKLKLSRSAVKKLRKYGDTIARNFVEAKLQELIEELHKGVEGSPQKIDEHMSLCQENIGDLLAYVETKASR